jgi:serine/threonine protein kinase
MQQPDHSAEDPLEELVAQCLEGESADNATALERACSAHPEHADELRRRVGALARLGIGETRSALDFPERLGEFVLLERLGGGGMGVVFRARQASLGREVALKVIRPEHLFFPRARERFRRETEAVARLQHAGIVPIYTVGEDKGVPYFAMELVPGCTLAEVLTQLQGRAPERLKGEDVAQVLASKLHARPDVGDVAAARFAGPWLNLCLHWTLEVAEALEHAHQRGVLHRDVKPSNVVIGVDGRARLLDFGLASLGDDDQARLTASGAALGSLLYMSPEQLRGESRQASERSDVYALGVTLYELLCLQAPYRDTSLIDLREAILQGRAEGLRTRNRAVSRDLEVVCLKAMESGPTHRYPSAAAFARDLRNVLERRPIEARAPSSLLRGARWVQRNPAASAALALAAALLVGVPTALLWQERAYAREVREALDDAL